MYIEGAPCITGGAGRVDVMIILYFRFESSNGYGFTFGAHFFNTRDTHIDSVFFNVTRPLLGLHRHHNYYGDRLHLSVISVRE